MDKTKENIVLIARGATRDEALQNALTELSLNFDEVIDEVIVDDLDLESFVNEAIQIHDESLDVISNYLYKAIIRKLEQRN